MPSDESQRRYPSRATRTSTRAAEEESGGGGKGGGIIARAVITAVRYLSDRQFLGGCEQRRLWRGIGGRCVTGSACLLVLSNCS